MISFLSQNSKFRCKIYITSGLIQSTVGFRLQRQSCNFSVERVEIKIVWKKSFFGKSQACNLFALRWFDRCFCFFLMTSILSQFAIIHPVFSPLSSIYPLNHQNELSFISYTHIEFNSLNFWAFGSFRNSRNIHFLVFLWGK